MEPTAPGHPSQQQYHHQSTDSAASFPAVKSKGISQLHFNAINNATTIKNIKYSNGAGDDAKKSLLPTQKKYIITPTQSGSGGSASSSSSATSPQPSTSKSVAITNGTTTLLQVSSTTSSATPSQRTSPVGSPTYYHRPKHYASMRSVKSGKIAAALAEVAFA